jgi:hypothetical protein
VDIVPNIVRPMITTMGVVHHIGVEPIGMADREPHQPRPAPTNRESIRKNVKFQNIFVSYIVKDVLCIIDQGKMNRETRSDYEIRCPKWKELMHTVMVNSVKVWKISTLVSPTQAAVEISPAVQGLILFGLLVPGNYVKSSIK